MRAAWVVLTPKKFTPRLMESAPPGTPKVTPSQPGPLRPQGPAVGEVPASVRVCVFCCGVLVCVEWVRVRKNAMAGWRAIS